MGLLIHAGLRKKRIVELWMDEIRVIKSFDCLPRQVRLDVAHQVKMKCKTYVVGALFEDTKRLFYSFSKKGEWIQINPRMYEFVCNRRKEIEKLNNYEWTHFLEKVNKGHSANHILTQYLLNTGASQVNTAEILFEAEEAEKARLCIHKRNQDELVQTAPDNDDTSDEIDEETRALLDDPVALIQLLKKRRGI